MPGIFEIVQGVGTHGATVKGKEAGEVDAQLGEIGNAEDQPGQGNGGRQIEMPQRRNAVKELFEPCLFHKQQQKDGQTPQEKVEAGAVPEAGGKPHDEKIAHGFGRAVSAAA